MTKIYQPIPGNDRGLYSQPSPEVATVDLGGGLYVNAAYLDDEPMHLRPPGKYHQNGTCGGIAGLCSRCFDLELKWHKQIVQAIAKVTPPKPDENYYDYTIRVRGRMLDTWPQAFGSVCSPNAKLAA